MFQRSFYAVSQAPPVRDRFSLLYLAQQFFGLRDTACLYANVEKQTVTYRLRDRSTKSGYDFVTVDFTTTPQAVTGRHSTVRRVLDGRRTD